jgi:hypothetical protein
MQQSGNIPTVLPMLMKGGLSKDARSATLRSAQREISHREKPSSR